MSDGHQQQDEAVIRQYGTDPEDERVAQFHVSKANMEPLATANMKALWSPTYLSLWLSLTTVLITVLKWWPDKDSNILGYLRPLPAIAACLPPILYYIDWYHRFDFERIAENKLKQPDMLFTKGYYSRSPSSGFFFCDFGPKLVGLIAIDASDPADTWQPSKSGPLTRTRTQRVKDVSPTAVIRHFYVVEKYRRAGVQDDLLAHAVKTAFEGSSTVGRIEATPPVLSDYLDTSLREQGFKVKEITAEIGIFKWPQLKYELFREEWEKKNK